MAEATQPGANVSANARTHWLSPNKFLCGAGRRWSVPGRRTRARRSRLSPWLCAFAEAGGIVEFVMGGVTLHIGHTVPTARVKELLRAVRPA